MLIEKFRWAAILLGVTLLLSVHPALCGPEPLNQSRIFAFKDDRPAELVVSFSFWGGGALFSGFDNGEVIAEVKGLPEMQVQILNQLFIQISEEAEIDPLIHEFGLSLVEDMGEGFYLLEAQDSFESAVSAEQLGNLPNVYAASPIMKWPLVKTDAYSAYPKDPLFDEQPHLENRNNQGEKTGIDLNVRSAWAITRGQGVSIAIVDDGIQTTHPDLDKPTKGQPHHDYVANRPYSDSAPPVFGFHGTNVAGLAAAEGDNDVGVSGVAPDSNLTSLLIFGERSFDFASDINLVRLFRHQPHNVQIQNHSWASGTEVLNGPSRIVSQAITNAVTRDRGGLGAVIVRSAGNFRSPGIGHNGNGNVNDDKYPSDPQVIAVAASDKEGKATTYSSPGAPILVAAPSGDSENSSPNLTTTDLVGSEGANTSTSRLRNPDYAIGSSGFNGTSASAPEIAGIAALILSVNPDLHYRDVQQILAMSAKQYFDDPHSQVNGGGFTVNDNVGFGIPDAGVAVRLAQNWKSRPRFKQYNYTKSVLLEVKEDDFGIAIPSVEGQAGIKSWIEGKPSLGPINDLREISAPLTFLGLAKSTITQDLNGRGALIERGEIFFKDKINRAAEAGALFAIIFNNESNNTLIMAETDYTPIPAIFIGRDDGQDLKNAIQSQPELMVTLRMRSKTVNFDVPDEILTEYVGLEFKSSIAKRRGIRITLISPIGTKSELHSLNNDNISSLRDWTFHSAQHMFESGKGNWRVQVSNIENLESSGTVSSLKLMIRGVAISDSDADGLDDNWELENLGSLDFTAHDDPDNDGYWNGYEQIATTSPLVNDRPFLVDAFIWKNGLLRLSWPGKNGTNYDVFGAFPNPNHFGKIKSVQGVFPTTDSVISIDRSNSQFFHILERNNSQ